MGLSLFLAVAFGAAWLRGVLVYSDGMRWTVHDDAGRSVRTAYVVSGGASVCVAWYTTDMPSLSDQAWALVRREPGSAGAEYGRDRFVSPGLEATWLNYRGAYTAGFGWAARRERGPWTRPSGVTRSWPSSCASWRWRAVTWATVKLHRDAVERDQRRRLGD